MSKIDFIRFIAASSYPATLATQIYIKSALKKTPSMPVGGLYIVFPILFGLANIVSGRVFGPGRTRVQFAATGTLFGLFLSTIGRFGYDLPMKLFQLKTDEEWKVHPVAAVIYTGIWALPIFMVDKLLIGQK